MSLQRGAHLKQAAEDLANAHTDAGDERLLQYKALLNELKASMDNISALIERASERFGGVGPVHPNGVPLNPLELLAFVAAHWTVEFLIRARAALEGRLDGRGGQINGRTVGGLQRLGMVCLDPHPTTTFELGTPQAYKRRFYLSTARPGSVHSRLLPFDHAFDRSAREACNPRNPLVPKPWLCDLDGTAFVPETGGAACRRLREMGFGDDLRGLLSVYVYAGGNAAAADQIERRHAPLRGGDPHAYVMNAKDVKFSQEGGYGEAIPLPLYNINGLGYVHAVDSRAIGALLQGSELASMARVGAPVTRVRVAELLALSGGAYAEAPNAILGLGADEGWRSLRGHAHVRHDR